jgi:uncharacterized paraquat-inducible protein A
MFGISLTELLIIGVLCVGPVIAGGAVLLFVLLKQKNGRPDSTRLIACPDCGQQISRRAQACPRCGCPMTN